MKLNKCNLTVCVEGGRVLLLSGVFPENLNPEMLPIVGQRLVVVDVSCKEVVNDKKQLQLDPKWKWAAMPFLEGDWLLFENRPRMENGCLVVDGKWVDSPFIDHPEARTFEESLCNIVCGEFVPADLDLDLDQKVIVWNDNKGLKGSTPSMHSKSAHFYSWSNRGRGIVVYADGKSSFTAGSNPDLEEYSFYSVVED